MRHDTSRAAGRPSPSRSMRPTSKSPTAAETRDFFSSLLGLEPRSRLAGRFRPREIERATYFRQHPLQALAHLVIGEPDFQEAVGLDRTTTLAVGERLGGMLRPVELDGQPRFPAAEIDDEPGDRRLPLEFPAIEAAVAQFLPEHLFGAGCFGAKAAGDIGLASHGEPGELTLPKISTHPDGALPSPGRLTPSRPLPPGEVHQ